MPTGKVNWEKNIASAMTEVDARRERRSQGIVLPTWLPYVACAIFGVLLANLFVNGHGAHPAPSSRDYSVGGQAALLMVAEDVQHYWDTYGSLPDEVPSPLANVLNITYERTDGGHFRLTMPHGSQRIVFEGSEKRLAVL